MRGDEGGPKPLAWSLTRIAKGVRRVDLTGFAAVEGAWPRVLSAAASGARPLRLAKGELLVGVSSGAHAARARRDASVMLEELATLLGEPPAAIRVVVRD